MFKCNNCKATFEHYDTITEQSGEKWYVCPFCRGTDFDEVKKPSADFYYTEKATVINYVVSAISAINESDIKGAKEILIEFVSDLIGDNPFEYSDSLNYVDDSTKDDLISSLCEILEVVKV